MNYFDKESSTWDKKEKRVERAKIIAEAIKSEITIKKDYSGIDFGCGTGLLGFHFVDDAKEFTFIDTSAGMIEKVNEKISSLSTGRVSARVQNISKKKLRDSADLIVSLQALHHIEDYETILKILEESLNPGGFLCIADLDLEDGSFHTDELVPHNGFDTNIFGNFLESLGLKKISLTFPYTNHKEINGGLRKFPVFVAIYQKEKN